MSGRSYEQNQYGGRRRGAPPARRRAKRRPSTFAYVLTLGAVAACALVASVMIFFKVQTIQVTGDNPYTAGQVATASGIRSGINLLSINGERTSRSILEKLPYIKDAQIILKPLSTVEIRVQRSRPVCVVTVSGGYALLDGASKVLEVRQNTTGLSLPVVTGMKVKTAEPGRTIVIDNTAQIEALRAIDTGLSDNNLKKISQIDVSDVLELSAVYDGRIRLVIGTSTDIQQKTRLGAFVVLNKLSNTEKGTLDISETGKAYFNPA